MSNRVQFVHLSGGREGSVDTIDGSEALLGRDRAQCIVHADPDQDPSISRVHAKVWFDGRRWHIQDEHSANGIRVDGEIVTRALLREGAVVELSQSVALRFELVPDQPVQSDATAVLAAAVRPSSNQDATGVTGEFQAEPTIYGGGGFETEQFVEPQGGRRRKRVTKKVQQELKMYRLLVVCLVAILFLVGGSWITREIQLKQRRTELFAASTAAANEAGRALFSEGASADWINQENTTVGVDDEGNEVVTTEIIRVLPEEKKQQRLSAVEALLAAAEAESKFAEETGEEIFSRNLSQDPFEAHIQQLMGELAGTPTNMRVPADFLSLVKKKVGVKLNSRHKGKWSARDAYCRLLGIQEELETTLTREVAALRKKTSPDSMGGRQSAVVKKLIYVAWVESQYIPTQCSVAAARGMWQFIPSTGRRFGMKASGNLDQRCDWRRATVAAAGYFDFLLREFEGYPFLALAAYNAGERRVGKVLKNPKVPQRLANFYGFTAAGVLPDETRNYVPSIVASAFVGDDYDKALSAWNASRPGKRPTKPWAPCSTDEMRPPPSMPCPNGPAACPNRR